MPNDTRDIKKVSPAGTIRFRPGSDAWRPNLLRAGVSFSSHCKTMMTVCVGRDQDSDGYLFFFVRNLGESRSTRHNSAWADHAHPALDRSAGRHFILFFTFEVVCDRAPALDVGSQSDNGRKTRFAANR